MEVADERRLAAGVEHPLLDLGHGRRRFGHVDGDPHHLRARLRELDALLRRRRASAVSVIVIDWTTIGAPPPTWTRPDFHAHGLVEPNRWHGMRRHDRQAQAGGQGGPGWQGGPG